MKLSSLIRLGFGLGLAGLVGASYATAAEEKSHSASEKTMEAFGKLKPLQDKKDWGGMRKLLEDLLPTVGKTSYDYVLIQDMRAKLFLQDDKLALAIQPWEEALKLSDQFKYFDEKYSNDIVLYLAQIIFSEASGSNDRALQQKNINRSLVYLKRYLATAKKPTLETQMFYAQLLYQQAAADPAHINQDILKQAREVVEKGMASTLQPKEGFFMLRLAILQQQNETQEAADQLEMMVSKFPAKKDYWPILMATYLNLASQEKDPEKQRPFYIRAINALEKAQKLGFMTTPKDNYNLVTIYITAGQFSRATELLHAGLKSGAIESSVATWRVLGSYYQQANKELDAIKSLQEAAVKFPKEGMLDLQMGEIYRQLEKTAEARDAYRRALAKGGLDKPQVAYQLLAYTSMELDDWTEAQRAIGEASKHPDFAKDQQMKSLKDHIDNTVREREEVRKIKEEASKKKTPASV